jgi:hypothetical protein
MTEAARYPSEVFPASVGFVVTCPEGWSPAPDAGFPLAVVRSVSEGEFRPNVIVSVKRMRKGTGLGAAVIELRQRATVLREYTAIGEEELEVDGWPGFRTEGSFIDERAGTLVQAIRLAAVDRGKSEDLIQLTGTCTAQQVPDVWPEIRDLQASLRFDL